MQFLICFDFSILFFSRGGEILCIYLILYSKHGAHICQSQIFHALLLKAMYLGLIKQGYKRFRIRWLLKLWTPACYSCINRKNTKKLPSDLFFAHDTLTYFILDWEKAEFRLDCSSEVPLFQLVWGLAGECLTNWISVHFFLIFTLLSTLFILTFHVCSFWSHLVTCQSDRPTSNNNNV